MTSKNPASSSAQPAIRRGAEPYRAGGGPVGVLLSHGFSGSPASMRPWAKYLAAQGFTVSVPRLPGHGTTWRDLNRTGWQDWFAELQGEFDALAASCDRVAVCGLSMGGALALRLAQVRPDEVSAVVVVNPAVASKRIDARFVPVLKFFFPAVAAIGGDIRKFGVDEVAYDKTPLRALADMMSQWKTLRAELDQVTAPLLYFRSTRDHVVDDSSTDIIRDGVSSKVNELVLLTESYHVATLDYDAQTIFEKSADFIGAHTQ